MGRLRDLIEKIDDRTTATVEVPEWGDSPDAPMLVGVQSMTAKARAEMIQAARDPETGELDFSKFYPSILIATAFDPDDNEPVFSAADVELINSKNAGAVERLATVGMRLSGMAVAPGGTQPDVEIVED